VSESNVVVVTTPDVPAQAESSASAVPAKASKAKTPQAPKVPEVKGVVGTMPVGFAELCEALETVRTGTDMRVEAIRADAAKVTRAMEKALGKKAAPPAGRGRFTGLRTYDFQNTFYAVNDREGVRFSDRAVCIAWIVELASNKCDFAEKSHYVASTRTDYVKGRHGSNVIDPKHTTSKAWPVPVAPKAETK
jgi:hypothetical protein